MAQVRIDWAKVHDMTIGEAFKIVNTVTREVLAEAKVHTRVGPYVTGFLSASLRRQVRIVSGSRVEGRVGSPLWYAMSVHNGAKRHRIKPLMAGYPLKFYWRKVGATVHFDSVNHPGQRGQFYLSGPLAVAGVRHGLKVTIN